MTFSEIIDITNGRLIQSDDTNQVIKTLIIDSRKSFLSQGALFFAIEGDHHDGHNFIKDLYDRGIRNFIVEQPIDIEQGNILLVDSSVAALQSIARHHREQFNIPIIGITGSNGKTIVKEWLYSCLSDIHKIARSPHSFNSQIGVPLSIWNMSEANDLAIFEAGISEINEMQKIADMVQPTIGIFTNLGSAHDAGFESRKQKFVEKSKLFSSATIVIYNGDQEGVDFGDKGFSWGHEPKHNVQIVKTQLDDAKVCLTLDYHDDNYQITLPFSDATSVENAMHCVTYMLYSGFAQDFIQRAINKLNKLSMRLELKRAVKNSYIIDDTYNNDLVGLQQAVDFISSQKQKSKKVLILSDLLQSGLEQKELYQRVAEIVSSSDISTVIGIGSSISEHSEYFSLERTFYDSTKEFLLSLQKHDLSDALILVKGARVFAFEKIVKALEEKIHGTLLEINLDALTNNLNFYRSKLKSQTKLMVMVKAFAYGSGSFEIANLLQFHRVDYLGVAYADEGVQLRKNGVYLPIMVMNTNEESYESLIQYDLEPVIYDLAVLQKFLDFLNGRNAKVHLEIDTGMNRLGFEESELDKLIDLLRDSKNVKVQSIFSHLAGADEDIHSNFSKTQASHFEVLANRLKKSLSIEPLLHLVNSPGILRFPEFHHDMVRLGIGLYGLEPNNIDQNQLQNISTLKTVISQIRTVKLGETIGYGRKGIAHQDLKIATIAIGYADGYSRAFSNGTGEVWVNNKRANVIGNVCMDMTMIDITECNAKVGDQVEIFGDHISIKELADKTNTIPYEILTNVSQRVKRVYYTE